MNITPVALLGQYEKDNSLYPAAQILNKDQNVAFDPAFVAGSIVSLYEAFFITCSRKQTNRIRKTI